MNKPKFTCESIEQFEALKKIYDSIPEKLKPIVEHITFQRSPFLHEIKLSKKFDDRVSIVMPIDPKNVTVVKKGWRVDYKDRFFTSDLDEKQSIEFHFFNQD